MNTSTLLRRLAAWLDRKDFEHSIWRCWRWLRCFVGAHYWMGMDSGDICACCLAKRR